MLGADDIIVLIAAAILVGPASALAGEDGPVRIVLRERAEVAGPFVALGEVAAVDGTESSLGGAAAGVLLGLAPDPGSERTITRRQVRRRLAEAGFPERSIRLDGAAGIVVSARAPASGEPTADGDGSNRAVVVARNARVTIRRRSGIVVVEDQGVALDRGTIGDSIRALNSRTGREEVVRVVGSGVVEAPPARPAARSGRVPAAWSPPEGSAKR